MAGFNSLFSPRQMLSLSTLSQKVNLISSVLATGLEPGLVTAVQVCLALGIGRQADSLSSLTTWSPNGEFQGHTFARQALPMVWDFAEVNPWSESSGNWLGGIEWICRVCEATAKASTVTATVERSSATKHPLPDGSAHAFVTDPPYYYSVPYADLADFFFVWLKRALPRCIFPTLLQS